MIHEDIYQSPFSTCAFITKFLQELELLEQPVGTRPMGLQRQERRWIPPPHGSAKGNVDMAISVDRKRSPAAAIFRNEAGEALGVSALVMYGTYDPICEEMIA